MFFLQFPIIYSFFVWYRLLDLKYWQILCKLPEICHINLINLLVKQVYLDLMVAIREVTFVQNGEQK